MRSLLTLFTILAVALPALSQPVVTSITPDRGPESGGTEITLYGQGLATRVNCLLPCPPRVAFGEVEVDAEERSDKSLLVTTPAHPAGTVDVTVTIPGEEPVVVESGFTFVTATEESYELVLLPVSLEGTIPGAYGSRWKTDFWLRNGGQSAVSVAPWKCPKDQACPPVHPLTYNLLPRLSLDDASQFASPQRSNPSQLLYLTATGAGNVDMSLRVADVSRDASNAGTDLPVVREDELLTGKAQLFQVPMSAAFRVLLRVYDVSHGQSQFVVRLYSQSKADSAALLSVQLTARTPQEGPFRTEAAYAELSLSDLSPATPLPSVVRVEVEALTTGSRHWAFVSATNNQTQLVTLMTPQ